MLSIQRLFVCSFLLLLCAGKTWAAGELLTSPVRLFPVMAYIDTLRDFKADTEAENFRSFIHILYDRTIGRPWEEKDYWREANARWKALRGSVCPKLSLLCAFPEDMDRVEKMDAIMIALGTGPVLAELQGHFGRYSIEIVKFPLSPDTDALPFNFFLSKKVPSQKLLQPRLWDMQATEVEFRDLEFVTVYDVESYFRGFKQEEQPNYFAFGKDNAIVFNVDSIQVEAERLANLWKNQADQRVQSEVSTLYFETLFLQRMNREYAERLQGAHDSLAEKLKSSADENAKAALERFAAERAKDRYPEEAYQQVAYELSRDLINTQALYFSLARDQRKDLNPKRYVIESVLSMQAQAKNDPRLLLFLLCWAAVQPPGLIVTQLVDPSIAVTVLVDQLKAVIGIGEYKNADIFSQFKYVFQSADLFDREFLSRENPELLRKLTKPDNALLSRRLLDNPTSTLEDVFAMSDAQQKEIFSEYLFSADGKIRSAGLFRLALTMTMLIRPADAAKLAEHIHEVRKAEFVR